MREENLTETRHSDEQTGAQNRHQGAIHPVRQLVTPKGTFSIGMRCQWKSVIM